MKALVGMEGLRLVEWVWMGVDGVLELIWEPRVIGKVCEWFGGSGVGEESLVLGWRAQGEFKEPRRIGDGQGSVRRV